MISVGVDIGSFSIKIAEIESTSKSYAIRRLEEFPLSLDLTKDKKIEIIDTLRTVLGQYDRERTQFIFAVPQKSVSMRMVNFPFRERFKVQKAVAMQLEDDLPFSPEDAVFDTKIVRYNGKGSDVLAMAVPKEKIAEVLGMANDCGTNPTVISAESLALNNLFERWSEPPSETAAVTPAPGPSDSEQGETPPVARTADVVFSIGHLSSQLLVHSEGVLIAVRSIDWGGKNLADAISQKYGLNYLQAMRELQSKGFLLLEKGQGTKEQIVFSQTLEKALLDLVSNVRLKMFELQSEFNLIWGKGYMLGGVAQLKNLGAFLTQSFEIPVNRYKQFENHPAFAFEASPHMESVCGVAVGLALEALRRPRNPATNFLKGEFAQANDFFKNMWDRWGYTIQLTATAFAFLFVFSVIRESLSISLLEESEKVLKAQAEAIANLKGKRASASGVRQFISNVEKDAKNRKQAEKVVRINSALDVLNRITSALPAGTLLPLEIKLVVIENDSAEVQGYTNTPDDVKKIVAALQKVSLNGKVMDFPNKTPYPTGKTPFAFKFPVQRVGTGG